MLFFSVTGLSTVGYNCKEINLKYDFFDLNPFNCQEQFNDFQQLRFCVWIFSKNQEIKRKVKSQCLDHNKWNHLMINSNLPPIMKMSPY